MQLKCLLLHKKLKSLGVACVTAGASCAFQALYWQSFAATGAASALMGCGVSQARADSVLQQDIGSMDDDQANAEALLHEAADAQQAVHWALEYEDIARVSLCFTR